jgi:hypothetical protein
MKLQSAFSAVTLASSVPLAFLVNFKIICSTEFRALATEYFVNLFSLNIHCLVEGAADVGKGNAWSNAKRTGNKQSSKNGKAPQMTK